MSYAEAMATALRAVSEPPHYETTWGDRLRRIRLAHGLHQDEMGRILKVQKPTVGRWELMEKAPQQHANYEDSVEIYFGSAAADFLRGLSPDGSPAHSVSVDYQGQSPRWFARHLRVAA